MKKLLWMVVVLMLCWAPAVLAEEPTENINFVEFQNILDNKCGKCHTRSRIEEAMAEGKAFQPIEERMDKHGADLNDRERDVMGVFWMENSPEPKKLTMPKKKDDPLAEYRSVLQARCTGCHTLDRVEQAMRENKSFDTLSRMMLQRGAVLNEADRKVLGTFWGEPMR